MITSHIYICVCKKEIKLFWGPDDKFIIIYLEICTLNSAIPLYLYGNRVKVHPDIYADLWSSNRM